MKEIDYLKLGNIVKKMRSKAGLTQEQLAELCEISTSFLGHIERGSRRLSLDTAVRIADSLNISLDALIIGGSEEDVGLLTAAESILKTQDKQSKERFLKLLRVLLQNIDEL